MFEGQAPIKEIPVNNCNVRTRNERASSKEKRCCTRNPSETRTDKWQIIHSDRKNGMKVREIAEKNNVSERSVYRVMKRVCRGKVRKAEKPGPQPGSGHRRTPYEKKMLVCEWKVKHPEKGHEYCYHHLKSKWQTPPSPRTIWRIWRREQLLRRKKRRQKRGSWLDRMKREPWLFQIDTAYLPGDRFLFCAVDTFSRWAFVEVAHSRDSKSAASFLQNLIKACPFPVTAVQTDNGSEFHGSFIKLAKSLNLKHIFAWVQCTDQNGIVERFIRTVREESSFGAITPSIAFKTLGKFARSWFVHYNYHRFHSSLAWIPPMSYLYNHHIISTEPS